MAHYAEPDWNHGRSAFRRLRRQAQQAIDEALGISTAPPGARVWRDS
ncbi:MAG TPA: hypothetical protein VHB53_03435 [Solirubrobacterales bacterium]|nr:hypothetical protein [Solirubrobacterales bacterium]